MPRILFRRLLIVSLLGLFLLIPIVGQAQDEPVVRAVLFYSPTCPHCHQVINDVLIPMVEEHGDRLQIVAIDVTRAGGQVLYQSAIEYFEIPEERLGVPTLVVNDLVLVGSTEIPDQFPNIVRKGLTSGIEWPAIPGFVPPAQTGEPTVRATTPATPSAAASLPATATEIAVTPTATLEDAETPPTPEMGPTTVALADDSAPQILDNSQQGIALDDGEDPPADPVGFALASAILIVMVVACAYVAWRLLLPAADGRDESRIAIETDLGWAIPILAVLGLGVATYLAYVEVNQVAAVCGPVGHCNLVQSSTYARILGIPIALLGIASYVVIVILWCVERFIQRDTWRTASRIGLIGLTVFGTLFSIYLTLLELFAIHAVCAWCLTSAVVMTLLMVLVVRPATHNGRGLAPG